MRSSQYQDNYFGFTVLFFTVLYLLYSTLLPLLHFPSYPPPPSPPSPPVPLAGEDGRSDAADFKIQLISKNSF